MNTTSSHTNNPKVYTRLGFVAAATFFVYLFFSVYYVTHQSEGGSTPISLRLKDASFLHSIPGWESDAEGDAAFYNRLALGVMQTGLPRNRAGAVSLYAPVYSYFLAGCYTIGGVRQLSVSIAQALIAAAVAWFAGLATGRLAPQLGATATLLAAGLILVNLRLAMYASFISPTMMLLLWFSLALLLAGSPLGWMRALGLGAVVSLGIFTQAAFFLMGFAFAFWLAWQAARHKRWPPVLACGLILLCIASRLASSASAASAGTTQKRENTSGILWEANNPYYENMTLTSLWERRPGNPWTHWHRSEKEQARYQQYLAKAGGNTLQAAVLWIRENPARYASLCLIRLRSELGPFTGQMSPRNRIISTFYWLLILPAALYALWQERRHPLTLLLLSLVAVDLTFSSLVIVEWYLRYRLPLELALTLFAGIGYAALLTTWRQRKNQTQ